MTLFKASVQKQSISAFRYIILLFSILHIQNSTSFSPKEQRGVCFSDKHIIPQFTYLSMICAIFLLYSEKTVPEGVLVVAQLLLKSKNRSFPLSGEGSLSLPGALFMVGGRISRAASTRQAKMTRAQVDKSGFLEYNVCVCFDTSHFFYERIRYHVRNSWFYRK